MNETNENNSSNNNSNLISQKLQVMLKIQDDLNKKVNADWRNAGYQWRDAIMVEAVELFDHLNWKWWKKYKAEPDWGQVKMEAVDIWHFIMSEMLCDKENADFNGFIGTRNLAPVEAINQKNVLKAARSMVGVSSGDYTTMAVLHVFLGLLSELGMDFDELYKLYVGKAKLNEVRWANDYGGTYFKNWSLSSDGNIEDNQYLTYLVNNLDVNSATFANDVFDHLQLRYKEVKEFNAKA